MQAHAGPDPHWIRPAALCAIVLAAGGTIAAAQSPGTFTPTGDMTTARSFHTATILPGGKVLIAGGIRISSLPEVTLLASTEIYDPATRTFNRAADMTAPRWLHSATLLPDGRVLIVGGQDSAHRSMATAELYDPSTGAFTATGPPAAARAGHTAVLLPSGKVLLVGGVGSSTYPPPAPAELYDPASGTFTTAGDYVARGGCDSCAPATLLPDGTVLVPVQYPPQIYDPVSDSFSETSMMIDDQSTAVLLTNGKVLFAGGVTLGRSSLAELYDPASHTFVATGRLSVPRVWHTLTLLPDGTALAAGGETDGCSGNGCTFAGSVASAELYDPRAGAFRPAGSMIARREVHTATLLDDGTVLIAGGEAYAGIGAFDGTISTAELYTPDVLLRGPALLSVSGDGRGQGAIFHGGTSDVASPVDPAAAGEIVDILCVGVDPASAIPPQVAIGGRMAAVVSVTVAAGRSGANKVSVRLPGGIAPGREIPVWLSYLGRPSNRTTMAVK